MFRDVLAAGLASILFLASTGVNWSKESKPAVRWVEGQPGCVFSRSDDGKYHYDLWHGDSAVLMAIDSQELVKVHRRNEPFFSVFLTVRYRGNDSLALRSSEVTLEFVNHFHVIQSALDPDQFAEKVQGDADSVDHQATREIQKHPERRAAKEQYVRAFQKDAAELIEFVSKNSLRSVELEPANAEARGWVFFSTASKWISGWKKQEEFILRVPFADEVFEFPFKLPPQQGEILLRKRN